MSYTAIPTGSLNWDVPVNDAFATQDSRITLNEANIAANTAAISGILANDPWGPVNSSQLAWNYDPAMGQTGSTASLGVLTMIRVDLPADSTVNNLTISISTQGATLTAGQNLAGLYDSNGLLLGQTADQSTNWTTQGLRVMPLLTPVSAFAGPNYIGILTNGTTAPSPLRGLGQAAQAGTLALGLTASNARWATTGSGLTALPSSVTMSGRTLGAAAFWGSLS